MTTCAEYATQLAEAKAALHKLTIGSKVERLRDGENELTYTKASISDLRAYVKELQGKVDACNGLGRRGRGIVFVPKDT